MNNIYFIADTHYGHKNIVKGVSDWEDKSSCRNFNTIEEMNQAIVKKINQVVKEDDILYHLGDWSFGGKENIWNFRKQINCKTIHLILGNHDEHIRNKSIVEDHFLKIDNSLVDYLTSDKLFTSVQDYLELPNPFNKKSKKKLVLCHYPIEEWNGIHKGWIHLHGHSHGTAEVKENRLDVYLDNNLKIWSLEEIYNKFKSK